ncbi:pyruvate kinase [Paucihalobacter sp.]|uniref:pyruvate kinase n=1 Tax=Paucihalobacter sp. TaxID=2850405 RepID=UPI003D1609A4
MTIERLSTDLSKILQCIIDNDQKIIETVAPIHPNYKLSAKNLCRYLLLRSYDLRNYHDSLSDYGVSSLATSEGYVYSNLYNVVNNLKLIQGLPSEEPPNIEMIGYKKSKTLLTHNTQKLFIAKDKKHFVRIMVTLPVEAAKDKKIIKELAESGMEIARINLSHGNLEQWTKMVEYIQEINNETSHNIIIYMDLSGPKLRIAPIEIPRRKKKFKNNIAVREDEHIILTRHTTKGKTSKFNKHHKQTKIGEIGVLLPEIIDDVQINHRVLFDDGMIESVVVSKTADSATLRITKCYKSKLASEKGINLPDTKLNLPALTERDIENLPFVCEYADIVGYSFVRTASDVSFLQKQLNIHNAKDIGVVYKIENKEAFENLPFILLEGMKSAPMGVMIARGDLAVEIGFERSSEVQNEILWLCEAAHVPVIWATQVLENLAKTGIPTRAEISDVVQGVHAECIMLNKGPFINDAVVLLKNILGRMEAHSFKKKNAFRALNVAQNALKPLLGIINPSHDV